MRKKFSINKCFITVCVAALCLNSCAIKSKHAADNYNYSLAVNKQNNVRRQSVEKITDKKTTKENAKSIMPQITYRDKKLSGEAAVNAANHKALRVPQSGGYVDSIMTFNYIPGDLYQVYCAPLRVTDIELQCGEHIISVGAGDTLRWQVSKTYSGGGANRQEHLLIKPTDEGITNSLVITTDQRTYHIMLYATPKTYMASVAWRYSDSDGLLTNFVDVQNSEETVHNLDMSRLNFNYAVSLTQGHRPNWYPSMVFNDGHKTYIKFPLNMQEAPTLFVGSSTQVSQIVNYRVVGDYYVIDGIYDRAQLRSGQNNPTIVQIVYIYKEN